MNKVIIYVILFSSYALGQVVPYQLPYSIESKEFIDIDIINNTIINFDEFDKESVGKQYVWQKTFNLKSNQRIIVKFNRQECLEELFLINSNGEFAGPYNIQNIDKTNPFMGSQLTIQISSEKDCNINEENFIIEKYQNKLNKVFYDPRDGRFKQLIQTEEGITFKVFGTTVESVTLIDTVKTEIPVVKEKRDIPDAFSPEIADAMA